MHADEPDTGVASPAPPARRPVGAEPGHELLLRELGRINSELATQRRRSATTLHDLGGPAEVMVELSESVLEHPSLDPLVRGRVEQLHRSATTMSALLADLNRTFSLDDPQHLEVQRLEVTALVRAAVEHSRLLAEAKQMRLLLLVDQVDGQGCWVEGDHLKLERALGNLLGNAVKFSPAGSTVSIAVDRGVEDAKISVHDEGPGIGEPAQERIFEAFHRERRTDHLPGMGLGLHLTRRIVEGHGGRVSVQSREGAGATFLVELPLAVDEVYADLA